MEIVACLARADTLADAAGTRIARARTAVEIGAAMASLAESVERELAVPPGGEEGLTIACGPGCAACCVLNVSALVPEAVAVAHYLRCTLSENRLTEMRDRLTSFSDRVRWVDDDERPRLQLPCPFLDDRASCTIHPARPLLCRSISSVDPRACREALASGSGELLMNLPQKILCTLTFTGLAQALQSRGLDARSIELTRMVRNLLDRPSLVDDFLEGRRLDFH